MNVLLLGGGGQLGTEIRRRWVNDTIVAPSHDELDIADTDAIAKAAAETKATAIVNCAAFHNVDLCESEPTRALLYNAAAVDAMAQLAQTGDISFLTVSTDYVFDGAKNAPYTEDDAPNPLSVYARSKLAGERFVLARNMKAFVVRTCGVYGPSASKSKGTFIDRMITSAQRGEPVRVIDDVTASPTFAGHLADALRELLNTREYGLYHAVNTGAVTWYGFVEEALRQAGVEYAVEAIKAADWKAAAVRPSYSALANHKLETLGIRMPTWEEGIGAYLSVR